MTPQQPQHTHQEKNHLFNYKIHETYLRPLLKKHEKQEAIRYEDLIQSWTKVQDWLSLEEKDVDDQYRSDMIEKVR